MKWGQGHFFGISEGILDELLLTRKPALPSAPLTLCGLPSGYSGAREFAPPCSHLCGHPAAWSVSHEHWRAQPPAWCVKEVPCAEQAILERSPFTKAWFQPKTGQPHTRGCMAKGALAPLQEQSGILRGWGLCPQEEFKAFLMQTGSSEQVRC